MREAILKTRQLACGYPGKTVLSGIHLEIKRGEIVSIIGPNGAGKTTLLKTLTRLLPPQSGRLEMEGRDPAAINRRELARKIAVVGQSPEIPPLTVGDYILLGRLPFFRRYQFFETRHDHQLAEKFMSLTGILALKDSLFTEISGGERQLAAIVRALVQEPRLLFLDEPTSHLDITHQIRIMDLITSLNRELSLTVIMVMHDLNLAAEYSDRLVLLDGERETVYQAGPPAEVLTSQAIRDVYKTEVLVEKHPRSGKPCLFLTNGGKPPPKIPPA